MYPGTREWSPPNNKWLEEICVYISRFGFPFGRYLDYPPSIFACARSRLRVPHCTVLALASAFEGFFFFFHQRPGFWSLVRGMASGASKSFVPPESMCVIVRRSVETSKTLQAALPVASEAALLVGALRSLRALAEPV